MARYMMFGLTCGTSGGTFIGGHRMIELREELEALLEAGGSEVDPSLIALILSQPVIEGETLDCGVLLNAAYSSPGRYFHIVATSSAPITFYLQRVTDGGTRGGAGTNISLAVNKGVLALRGISEDNKRAALSYTVYADYDGTNLPIVRTTGVDLPSGVTGGAAQLWRLSKVIPDSTALERIGTWALDFGLGIGRVNPLPSLYARDTHIVAFAPTARFTTEALATALTASGLSGAALSTSLRFVLAPYSTSDGTIAATGAIGLDFAAGSMYCPQRISVGRQTPLQIEYMVYGKGGAGLGNPPLTLATGLSVAAEGTTSEAFMAGPAKHNTTAVEFDEGDINFDIQVRAEGPASVIWPTHLSITQRMPQFALRSADADAYVGLTGLGGAINTAFHWWLRRMTADSQPVADATTSHLKLSINAGLILPVSVGGGHLATGQGGLRVIAKKGGSAMLSVAANQAIS